MSGSTDVFVIAEIFDGSVAPVTLELLAAATPIAKQLGGSVCAVVCSPGASDTSVKLIEGGADKVYTLEDQLFSDATADTYVSVLLPFLKEALPSVVLLGRTFLGSDIGPRLAFALKSGLAQDCTSLQLDATDSGLIGDRPVYGGVSVARVKVISTPAFATVRPKAFDPLLAAPGRSGEVIPVNCVLNEDSVRVKLTDRQVVAATGIALDGASIVVAGGRGLGGPEPFEQLHDLAELLGGAVGASRAVCDAGWLPYSYQIGLTGKTISAEVYIGIGISGASQHMTGIASVKHVIGINKDEGCDLFKTARFGVVGDWEKVLPSLIDSVRQLEKS